ncbi:unnamed protein product [Clonostachys rhizophaga]|uniref:Nucleoside phosphorylase domain-containing protein n=1 Tax=Clonostachys rhizophaga TaxID=160324 RepID=A0A9N9VJJ1_9HYPO|nr:unnamed protein product [Clonostachys rhizophaga]
MNIRLPLEDGNRAPSRVPTRNIIPLGRYTIAWICALPIEMAAAQAMLDETHANLGRSGNDTNSYCLGSIKNHNVVIACLHHYGTINAADVVTNLIRTFSSVRRGLMVGIGGGAPSQADVRLGDVVVGTRVMQYESGKVLSGGMMLRTAIPKVPELSLRKAVSSLRAGHELHPSQIPLILQEKMKSHVHFGLPKTPDRLFRTAYNHEPTAATCENCDKSQLKERRTRVSVDPVIHYGVIASGDKVMKDGVTRDAISQELNAICFEMEAAGLMDILPCLSIRGICDYSDSHKTKEWQRYAAATSAAYAREFLGALAADGEAKEPCSASSCDRSNWSNVGQATASNITIEQPVSTNCPKELPKRREELLKSLIFQQFDARKANLQKAHKETCGWFLDHPDYKDWLDPEKTPHHHGFLWIRGKPGAGKSIMMKFLYLHMKKKDSPRKVLTASFFFVARGDLLERSVSGMYRSLLLQLLEGFPDLQRVLDDQELIPRNMMGCPPLNVLKNVFRAAVSFLGNRSYTCFIDALDECDEQQAMDMVDFFDELTEHCTENGLRLQVCFSSRHYPYIDTRSGIRLTLENQDGHSRDLKAYVKSHLRIRNPSLVEELIPTLLEKAAGVFLWVALVVDILNKENNRGRLALRKRLSEVPSGLSELFKDMLSRNQKDVEELRLSIIWILFAERPLRPEEYYHALWSGLSSQGLADLEMPTIETSDADDCCKRCVTSSSKGLAEITTARRPIVQFIHESVRDFLLKDKGLNDLWPDLGSDFVSQCHDTLKACCFAYFYHSNIREVIYSKRAAIAPITKKSMEMRYPFLEYASRSVLFHANAAADVVPQEGFLKQFPVSNWKHTFNIFEDHKTQKYDEGVDILYILADRGLPALIRTRLETDVNIEIRGGRFKYPLLAAMAKGRKDTVAALLGLSSCFCDGIDITESLKADENSVRKHHTPFTWACGKGFVPLARLILQKCVHIDDMIEQKSRALLEASTNGNLEVAKWLVGLGVDLQTSRGRASLSSAASEGHIAVVQLLLEKGAAIDSHSGIDGMSPLSLAAQGVSPLLLELGRFLWPVPHTHVMFSTSGGKSRETDKQTAHLIMSEPSTPRSTTYLQRAYALSGDAQAQHFYDEWADAYETDNNGLGYASPRRAVEAILKNVTGDARDTQLKVLDAGCGTGLVGACLAQSALAGRFVLDGLDLSPGMLAAARQKGVYRELEEANLNERIRKPDGSYDLIVCVGTLTVGHVGPGVLREFARVAAPSGLIVATVHSSIWESKGYKAVIESLRNIGTIQIVSTDEFGLVEEASTGGIMVVLKKN